MTEKRRGHDRAWVAKCPWGEFVGTKDEYFQKEFSNLVSGLEHISGQMESLSNEFRKVDRKLGELVKILVLCASGLKDE
jgi:hypothetical protein